MKPKNAVRLDRSIGRVIYKLHCIFYRLTGGLIGHWTHSGPILLLTTTGRKSGKKRINPLLYMPDGPDSHQPERYLVAGSNGGRPQPPAWLLNLQADPRAVVQVRSRRFPVKAEILAGEAKAEVWPRMTTHYVGWSYYETLTDRTIWPVALVPLTSSVPPPDGN